MTRIQLLDWLVNTLKSLIRTSPRYVPHYFHVSAEKPLRTIVQLSNKLRTLGSEGIRFYIGQLFILIVVVQVSINNPTTIKTS